MRSPRLADGGSGRGPAGHVFQAALGARGGAPCAAAVSRCARTPDGPRRERGSAVLARVLSLQGWHCWSPSAIDESTAEAASRGRARGRLDAASIDDESSPQASAALQCLGRPQAITSRGDVRALRAQCRCSFVTLRWAALFTGSPASVEPPNFRQLGPTFHACVQEGCQHFGQKAVFGLPGSVSTRPWMAILVC
ncbi:unnamed protein product [Prorocentrum cordatum]|uniref:Uncharacterized protein n=1 Tax=Prorocentrum cordatum TaxID=2364126 RepID=A0ABN9VZ07_9DINO|nr:unnamed protein product [Polarella glacialis]